ncbi:MAG: hypothetical protein IIY74_01420, partial [Firmicutes bacterium]|nr:hypothetical protein [Bacillota bacterium]
MIKLYDEGIFLKNGTEIIPESEALKGALGMTEEGASPDGSYLQETIESAKRGTIAYNILKAHNTSGSMDRLSIRFDSL